MTPTVTIVKKILDERSDPISPSVVVEPNYGKELEWLHKILWNEL